MTCPLWFKQLLDETSGWRRRCLRFNRHFFSSSRTASAWITHFLPQHFAWRRSRNAQVRKLLPFRVLWWHDIWYKGKILELCKLPILSHVIMSSGFHDHVLKKTSLISLKLQTIRYSASETTWAETRAEIAEWNWSIGRSCTRAGPQTRKVRQFLKIYFNFPLFFSLFADIQRAQG